MTLKVKTKWPNITRLRVLRPITIIYRSVVLWFRYVMQYRRVDIVQKSRSACYGFTTDADHHCLTIVVKLKVSSRKHRFWVYTFHSDIRRCEHLFGFHVPYRCLRFIFDQNLFKTKFKNHCHIFILQLAHYTYVRPGMTLLQNR